MKIPITRIAVLVTARSTLLSIAINGKILNDFSECSLGKIYTYNLRIFRFITEGKIIFVLLFSS